MPYQLEKGTTFSVTESVLDDLNLRIPSLAWLRGHPNENFDTRPTLESTSLDDPNNANVPNKAQRLAHQSDWYGEYVIDPATGQLVQKPYAPDHRTTGYWRNWYGNSQGIVREVWIRAIEVSLGVPHDPQQTDAQQIHDHRTREWPIEVFWRCPAPWFEGWITWRGKPEGNHKVSHSGHVTVHFHTPGHNGGGLIQSPQRPGYLLRNPVPADYKQEPVTAASQYLPSDGERGMWVVAQQRQELRNPDGWLIEPGNVVPNSAAPGNTVNPAGTQEGQWYVDQIPIGAGFVSTGDVVVVQPSEPDGGVVAGGRPYTP